MSTNSQGVNPGYGTSGWGLGGYGNQPLESLPIGYYIGLLTSQYTNAPRLNPNANSPKLNALLYLLLSKLDDVTFCLTKMDTSLDLDNAVGAQLDQWGFNLSTPRAVAFQPSDNVSPILDDDTYRLLLKARIAQYHWDGTIDSLYSLWNQLFPGGTIVIEDNQNMTATIVLTGTFSSIQQDLITNGYIVPRPEGVLYTYDFGVLPYFGFGSAPGFIAGFGQGHWV